MMLFLSSESSNLHIIAPSRPVHPTHVFISLGSSISTHTLHLDTSYRPGVNNDTQPKTLAALLRFPNLSWLAKEPAEVKLLVSLNVCLGFSDIFHLNLCVTVFRLGFPKLDQILTLCFPNISPPGG